MSAPIRRAATVPVSPYPQAVMVVSPPPYARKSDGSKIPANRGQASQAVWGALSPSFLESFGVRVERKRRDEWGGRVVVGRFRGQREDGVVRESRENPRRQRRK